MSRVAAVIPTYGHFDYAKVAVQSFIRSTPGSIAILVDDGSPDWPGDFLVGTWAPPGRILHHRFPANDKNLTRSWNKGLQIALKAGAEYTVLTNSDVYFVKGWWASIEYALTHGVHLAGPITNAPGHRSYQGWELFFPNPKKTDDDDYLVKVMQAVRQSHGSKTWREVRGINGFCMAAKTSTWWTNPYGQESPLDPKFKMEKNEDKMAARWRKFGRKIAIVPGSLVFHYRGVSRGRKSTLGPQGKGHFRF